ncbi:hypothetical protein AB733_20030 [Photobacterium swingsii]|uniref:BCTnown n=1 Tax=Photobacterium swingsii TaxID=680026 RepID=A0A0J8V6K5_9GAMM|nr:hypothetical protein [Photobacterium swingsii]KMV29068.1 hypothetical protein AB733_20030 [Photobacterium swingsii]PSW19110.1 hypothetical protein C9I94_23860 [Photobacterium swingsii]
MDNETEILGYVVCRTCLNPKSIKQGKGKRAAFVHGRCECGPDTRTGKAAQVEMKAFKPLEEVQSEIEVLKTPKSEVNQVVNEVVSKPNQDTESKQMGTVACVGIGAVMGLVFGGLVKTLKMVA